MAPLAMVLVTGEIDHADASRSWHWRFVLVQNICGSIALIVSALRTERQLLTQTVLERKLNAQKHLEGIKMSLLPIPPTSAPQNVRRVYTAGRSGYVNLRWSGAAVFQALATFSLPGNAIKPSCQWDVSGTLSKIAATAFNAGATLRIFVNQGANSVVVGQNSLNGALGNYTFDTRIRMSSDRKWGFIPTINMFNKLTVSSGDVLPLDQAGGTVVSFNANQASVTLAFATYAGPPFVETILIDFSKPITVTVEIGSGGAVSTGDVYGLEHATLSIDAQKFAPNAAPANLLGLWGHSLPSGTGATTVNTAPLGLIRINRPGRPVLGFGLGGQKIQAIADRILSDPVIGKSCDMVLWGLENDMDADPNVYFASIKPQLDRIMAFRAPSAKTAILTPITSSGWTQMQRDSTFAIVPMLLADPIWGSKVFNQTAPICTDPDKNYPAAWHADPIHMNDTGYSNQYTLGTNPAMIAQGFANP